MNLGDPMDASEELRGRIHASLQCDPNSPDKSPFLDICGRTNGNEEAASIVVETLLSALDADPLISLNAVQLLDICVKGSQTCRDFVHSQFVQSKLLRVAFNTRNEDTQRALIFALVSWHSQFPTYSLFRTAYHRFEEQGILDRFGIKKGDVGINNVEEPTGGATDTSSVVYVTATGVVTMAYYMKVAEDLRITLEKLLLPTRSYLQQHVPPQTQQLQQLLNTITACQHRVTQMVLEVEDAGLVDLLIQVNDSIVSTLEWYRANNGQEVEIPTAVLSNEDLTIFQQNLIEWKTKLEEGERKGQDPEDIDTAPAPVVPEDSAPETKADDPVVPRLDPPANFEPDVPESKEDPPPNPFDLFDSTQPAQVAQPAAPAQPAASNQEDLLDLDQIPISVGANSSHSIN